jgi:hypothetical protein
MRVIGLLIACMGLLLALSNCTLGPRPGSLDEAMWFSHAKAAEYNGLETVGYERDIPLFVREIP